MSTDQPVTLPFKMPKQFTRRGLAIIRHNSEKAAKARRLRKKRTNHRRRFE